MKKYKLNFVAILLTLVSLSAPRAFTAPTTAPVGPSIVMIIRHAEKPEQIAGVKDPDLSPAGFKRADALAKVIPDHFPRPDFLIATQRSKGSNRPVETITPLSNTMQMPIDTTFKDEDYPALAHEILSNPKYAGKIVLIAWHHGKIPELARALGVTDAPEKWKPEVFDRVWQITYEEGKAVMKDLPQKALMGDAEK